MLTDADVAAVRERFPILRDWVYLYNCSQGALSDAVEEGMREYMASWKSSTAPWDEWVRKYEEIRGEFARFINAEPDEIAVVTSASAGINPIASALDFTSRDKVVMGEYEFPTMGQIWLAQQQRGARVEFVRGMDNRIPFEAYEQAIDERTRIVAVTQVSFVNGFRSDVESVTRVAHERGALVFLDGYQDCGTRPLDVKKLGVDFYVTGTLKYLLGPPGLAFLYVREGLAEEFNPPMTSWLAQREAFSFNPKKFDPAPCARRFEGGSPPIPNIYAGSAALRLLSGVGLRNVAERVEALSREFLRRVQELGLRVKTPGDTVGPLIVLQSDRAMEMVERLRELRIVVSPRLDGVRFAFHFYNTFEDVDRAVEALKRLG